MKDIIKIVFQVVGIVIISAGLSLLLAFPIKWAWNYAMTFIFGLPVITW